MKKLIILITLVLALFTVSYGAIAQETVRLTNGEWPPYQSEHLKYYGLASRIVTEAFALEGIHVEYGFFPWNRAFMLAKKGRWNGTLVWSYSEDRAKDFYFSDPVIYSKWVFFHLKTTPFDWSTIDDLKDFKIGATIGYDYGKDFQEAEKAGRIDVQRVARDEQNFVKLFKGRIHIFPQDVDVGYVMINTIFTEEEAQSFTHHPRPIKDAPFSLLLSKEVERNKQLLEVFNRGLKRLRESGKVEQYLSEFYAGGYERK